MKNKISPMSLGYDESSVQPVNVEAATLTALNSNIWALLANSFHVL